MMHGYGTDSTDWLWMVPMMLGWVAVFGLVVYGAMRVALHHNSSTIPNRKGGGALANTQIGTDIDESDGADS